MTSNLGSDICWKKWKIATHDLSKEELMAILDPVIANHFRPEFINRLDDILPFLPLKEDDMEKIVEIQLELLEKRMQDRELNFPGPLRQWPICPKKGTMRALGQGL